ncbi:acyloxyacyl hydrolase [Variovorax sp. J22P240]|uniref:acyloxyacyl hydrolase n=1 Tax=Variovorax sp. J22P240 TaxID=3053514 RepID=UPI0025786D11|nr:acyloxyacyl hydrolase [Variovorax sp. J22P240]MDM0001069.1 acyloxyacyl hydrolase [Variovorax sp. J22P240]
MIVASSNKRGFMQSCLPSLIRATWRGRAVQSILLSAVALSGSANAGEALLRNLNSAYVQAGAGDDVASATIGVTWDLPWRLENDWGLWEGYLDFSLGRWRISRSAAWSGRHEVTQVGITPVIRLRPRGWSHFFFEAGIGANWIFPIYGNGSRRFSTAFNFGDHLALGWQFGAALEQEVTLRLQHFSNAGIKHPNPGENFVQLRYAYRF